MTQRMALLGISSIEYDGEERFSVYLERFENFIECNGIEEERKKTTFLTVIGPKLYATLKNLCVPRNPKDKTFEELKEILLQHLEPETSVIVERYKFNQRSQQSGESVADYIMELKKLSICCRFGDKLNDMIRDRFISGIYDTKIKMRLLNEPQHGMTLGKAVEIANSMERTERNLLEINKEREGNIYNMETGRSGERRPEKGQQLGQYAMYGRQQGRSSYGYAKGEHSGGYGDRRQQGRPSYGYRKGVEQRQASGYADRSPCGCCGKDGHKKESCWFKDKRCRLCSKTGHLQVMCRKQRQNYICQEMDYEETDQDHDRDVTMENCFFNMKLGTSAYKVTLNVCNADLQMEIDTGSAISAISKQTYDKYFYNLQLLPCNLILKSYTNTAITPMGFITATVNYDGRVYDGLSLYVFENGGPPLVGRDWLKVINLLNVDALNMISLDCTNLKENLKEKYPNVFNSKLGTYKKKKIDLKLKEHACPKYYKARPLPFSMKELVEKEIARLVEEGILTPVQSADWASPIVPVLKDNGQLRICGDFKVSVNPHLEDNKHPIPRIEDLFVNLQKGQKFSKIDLSHAYQQCLLTEESKKLVVINTHLGLFAYNRLPFGIKTAPNLFQSIMDQLFKGFEKQGIATFLDDIIITGKDDNEHLNNVMIVISKLEEAGLTVNLDKCTFMSPSIRYLGYILSADGLLPDKKNVEAILKAPEPKNLTELKSFLGMINYYLKFIPNAATLMAPFYRLTKKNVEFYFDDQCKTAFEKVKSILVSPQVLAHYDPDAELFLACDASAYGLGAVLSQKKNGIERPIAFASRILNSAEKNYSQVDKEALALIFGIKKFNQYVWGRKFTLLTDSKPLLSIFGPKKGIPVLAAGRLQRYAFLLSGYDYNIIYVRSEHNNADFFSRLPLQRAVGLIKQDYSYLNFINDNSFLPLDCKEIKKETEKDPVLKDILNYTRQGWPNHVNGCLQQYFSRREQLTVEQGILMYGHRVVIPTKLISNILKELHSTHLGIVKMKSLARAYFWWVSIDKDIELLSNSCSACLALRQNPQKTILHSWEYPKSVWTRLHMDYLGPLNGKMYLVIQCAYSKWIEVAEVTSTSASQAIVILKKLFTTFGFPELVCSDNGPPFHAHEFKDFLRSCGVRQVYSPPYHPQSNGCAESAVKIIKNCIKKAVFEKKNVLDCLNNFLMLYRNAQHSATGETPAMLMLKRNLRTKFDLLKPDLHTEVVKNQEKQRVNAGGKEVKNWDIGQSVLARSYRDGRWIEGIIVKQLGPVTYLIKLLDTGVLWKRHVDQLMMFESMGGDDKASIENVPVKENVINVEKIPANLTENVLVNSPKLNLEMSSDNIPKQMNDSMIVNNSVSVTDTEVKVERSISPVVEIPERRYPRRAIKKPNRLDL